MDSKSKSKSTSTSLPAHLQPPRSIFVVVSAGSGTGQAKKYYVSTLEPQLRARGLESPSSYTLLETESAATIGHFATEVLLPAARSGNPQTVILLSGDGGVVDLLNALAAAWERREVEGEDDGDAKLTAAPTPTLPPAWAKPLIALLPVGTANALAHSAGIAVDPLTVLFHTGTPKPLPMFRVCFGGPVPALEVADEGRKRVPLPRSSQELVGAVVCSWGLHASLVALSETAEYCRLGLERFKLAADEVLKNDARRAYRGAVRVLLKSTTTAAAEGAEEKETSVPLRYADKEENENENETDESNSHLQPNSQPGSSTHHAYVLATLVSNLEEQFCISPSSSKPPLDGRMHLVAFGPASPAEVVRILTLAYNGGAHVQEPAVWYGEIRGLRIDFHDEEERGRIVCVDGRIVAVGRGGWVEVRLWNEGGGGGGGGGSSSSGSSLVDILC